MQISMISLKQGIKVVKLDYFKNASYVLAFEKILFVLDANEYLARLEGKVGNSLGVLHKLRLQELAFLTTYPLLFTFSMV